MVVVVAGVGCTHGPASGRSTAENDRQAREVEDAVGLLATGKVVEGMDALRSLAEKGNVEAQITLGDIYSQETRIVTQVNYSEAMKWYRLASSQGSGEGSSRVAELYEKGLGIPRSTEQAKVWWNLAAKQGYDQQELDVRCFTRTVNAESLSCRPWPDGSGCPTDSEMERLHASGVTGIMWPTGGGGGRFRLGPKARALIIFDHRIVAEEHLKQPQHTSVIYVQRGTGWELLPQDPPLLDRPIVLSPQSDAPRFILAGVQDVDGSISYGGCASWPNN